MIVSQDFYSIKFYSFIQFYILYIYFENINPKALKTYYIKIYITKINQLAF